MERKLAKILGKLPIELMAPEVIYFVENFRVFL